MANSLIWKVYDAAGKYQAVCKEVEAAAAMIGFYGPGASIRYSHGLKAITVWNETEAVPAAESFDAVAIQANEILAAAFSKAPSAPPAGKKISRNNP